MRTSFHYQGVQYAAKPGAVTCTTQLYHVLRHDKLLPDDLIWDDLEKFWKSQGDGAFFVGDPPTDRAGYFKNYSLSVGTSVTNWAPNKRSKTITVNEANRRNLKSNGWVSLSMGNRLIPTGARAPLSSLAIEGVLDAGRRHRYLDGKGKIRLGMKDKAQLRNSISLSPAALIRRLADDIHSEVPDIKFNYFAMHSSCWDLLRKMKEEFTRVDPKDLHCQASPTRKVKASTFLLNASTKVVTDFLESGRGHVIKDAASKKVTAGEVRRIVYMGDDGWGLDNLMKQLKLNKAPGVEEECRMQ
ncbi:Uu.00g031170.m01.CDS01 [Anthostomella pinea]|uniref:Uu.00g031170.m01.CDS01 n=1 Tax=Anthostomella pinea TaxID=933095 RepID=A0AAI8YAN0_9PEZI|nr:Uu.00g031170.m01.CDS01 [Anthostomella pinea]